MPLRRSAKLLPVLPPRPLRLLAGAGIALGVVALVAVVFYAIISAARTASPSSAAAPDIAHLLRMTTIQAGLSTALSLVVGIGVAWALNRLKFPGRNLIVGLFAAAIVTPGIIIAFGVLTIWGRSGWMNTVLHPLLGTPFAFPVFGLVGILIAHVILDGAFAARILLARLDTIPATRLKTGQSLGLSATRRFMVIDWPTIVGTLPGLGAIIFLLAFTSFPIVLLLGGGPANQTLEVAIYAAVRLDFDLHGAVMLALVQIGVCSIIIFASAALGQISASPAPSHTQNWADKGPARMLQWTVLVLAILGFALPLCAILAGMLGGGFETLAQDQGFWHAFNTSLVIGLISAVLTLILALGLAMARAATGRAASRIGFAAPAYAYLAVPPVVLALGLFLTVRTFGFQPERAGPFVVIIANALLSLPFAIATLGPSLDAISRHNGRLIVSLGLTGWRQFTAVEWPLLGRDIGVVLALAFCFSLGDLGVISLFGSQDFVTLPLLLVRELSAYRTNDAAAIAALMLIVTILAFAGLPPLFERLSRARAR